MYIDIRGEIEPGRINPCLKNIASELLRVVRGREDGEHAQRRLEMSGSGFVGIVEVNYRPPTQAPEPVSAAAPPVPAATGEVQRTGKPGTKAKT